MRKKRESQLSTLARRISQLASSQSPDTYKECLTLQAECDILMTHCTTELLLRTRSQFYEHSDKASKLLAHPLCQRSTSRQIQTNSGITTDPRGTNNTFKEFYSSLNSSNQDSTSPNLDTFSDNLSAPSVDVSVVEELDKPTALAELHAAAFSLQNGKCPGPDGYPCEFYKKFWHKLAPLLLDMFNEALNAGCLPQTVNQASISLLLKKDTDPLACSSYRPISLLNVDFILLSKLLPRRLESVLPSIISSDQTGVIKNRHFFFFYFLDLAALFISTGYD